MEEEEVIRYYFQHGYDYNTIMDFFAKFHDIHISRHTLLNRLKKYGLRRRGCEGDVNLIRELIRRELDGYVSLLGYRAMWKRLHSKYGKEVPRLIVQKLLKELDPEGSKHRSFYSLSNKNKFFIITHSVHIQSIPDTVHSNHQ